jgi:hypothetical protein
LFLSLHLLFLFLVWYTNSKALIAFCGNVFFILCIAVLFFLIYIRKNKIGYEFIDQNITNYGELSLIVFHIILLLTVDIFAICIVFYFSMSNGYVYSDTVDKDGLEIISQIGSFIGGVIGPLISLVAFLLVFVTLKLQSKQIRDTQKAIEESKHLDTIPFLFEEYEKIKKNLDSLITDFAKRTPEKSIDFFAYIYYSYQTFYNLLTNSNSSNNAYENRFLVYELYIEEKGKEETDFSIKMKDAKEWWDKMDKSKSCFETFLEQKRSKQESFNIYLAQYLSVYKLLFEHLKFSENDEKKKEFLINYQQLLLKKMSGYEKGFHYLNNSNEVNKIMEIELPTQIKAELEKLKSV